MAGRFTVEAIIQGVDKFSKPIRRMQTSVSKFTRSSESKFRRYNKVLNRTTKGFIKAGKAAAKLATVGLGLVTTAVILFIREFSKIEDAEAAFTPLLGSVAKAKELVAELNKTSASTPFQFTNLANVANQLLPIMNGNIENTIKTIRMLGDTSGGNAEKLTSIARGFTKAMLKGKVDLESLNMIGEAGVPIFQELAKTMGTEVNEAFFKMITAGKITTKDLTKAFEQMTSEGGIFFGGMDIASKTTSGLFSTMKDNISLAAAEIGEALAPTIKELIKEVTGIARKIKIWAKANKELISEKFKKFLESVRGTFNFLRKHGSTILWVAGLFLGLFVVLKTFIVVMTAVNLVLALNPIGLIILGIAALIAIVVAAVIWFKEIKNAIANMSGVAIIAIMAILPPIGFIIGAAKLLINNWDKVTGAFVASGAFIKDVWEGGGLFYNWDF